MVSCYNDLKTIFKECPSVTDSFIEANSNAIMVAPRITCLRINEIHPDKDKVEEYLNVKFPDFERMEIPKSNFKNVILLKPKGPYSPIIPAPLEVIVSIECGEAVLRGASVYAPGVKAIEISIQPGDLVSVWADLSGTCTQGLMKKFIDSDGKRFIANGLAMKNHSQVFKNNERGIAVKITESEWILPSFDDLNSDSLLFPQNLPCICAVEEMNIQPNHIAIDMCASPGGKASHILSKLSDEDNGMLFAIDKNKNKVNILQKTLERLSLGRQSNFRTLLLDSAKLSSLPSGTLSLADRILLDPPCSGLGQRPTLKYKSIIGGDYASYQKRLVKEAYLLLKEGGIMVYSTCTLHPEENEGVIQFALSLGLRLLPPQQSGSAGLDLFGLGPENASKLRRYWPASQLDTIAFFYAILQK